jgi:hypothetical protein
MTRLSILLAVTGCYTSTSTPTPPPISNSSDLVSCPAPVTVASLAATLIGVDVVDATCVAGRFPRPGYVITARYQMRDERRFYTKQQRMIVVSNVVLAREETELQTASTDWSGTDTVKAFDFDRDGTDELLVLSHSQRTGASIKHLTILRFAEGGWKAAFVRQVEYDDSPAVGEDNATRCQTKWKIATHRIELEPITIAGNHCPTTQERWVLKANGQFWRDD